MDPPYNTGNDFVYKDNFKDGLQNYLVQTGQVDSEGNQLSTNFESNGRFHTDWLNMMYPRLKLARNLLTDDGAIFISIDDSEEANLVKICDEIFGEKNRVGLICHKSRASVSNDKIISPNHNRILFYAKNIEILNEKRQLIGEDPDLSNFEYDDNDGKGPYRLTPVDGPGGAKKGNPYYEFLGVQGYFRYSKGTMEEKYSQGLIVKKSNSLYQKYYMEKAKNTRKTVTTWWDDGGLTSTATTKLKKLMGGSSFDTPKPIELIERMIKMIAFDDKSAIVLDFFSGSSTTAHSVMKINAMDGGQRKFIMVQLPEVINEKSEAYENGYRTISEIGQKRIILAGEELKKEFKKEIEENYNDINEFDIGFKVFSLDSSNIREWNVDFENLEKELDLYDTPFVEGRTELDVVYEIMLKYGLELTYPIHTFEVDGKNVYDIAFGNLFICLAKNISTNIPKAIIAKRDEYGTETSSVVFSDAGFAGNDSEKLNCIELLKDAGYPEDNLLTI
ncbi:site-specific DNA-methyltransferase [Heyndrickxia sporothermodurans]|uniref:site-specific DNA-methyltransferase n=1 Tax=Heyndrickxia sporothermodurans TaxID=46224 RepID=UPI002DB89DBE|nr:site-specific DNA-methyltransferase [Heyndrickxia sporothermodurans]MEB6549460.1 site-specific DNA-methyltransferase [Heyndrickxia sporothermodurans]